MKNSQGPIFLIEREFMSPLPNRMLITVSFIDSLFFRFNTNLYYINCYLLLRLVRILLFPLLGSFWFLSNSDGRSW